MKNIYQSIPTEIKDEIFEDLLKHENIRVERILSKGQITPANEWYDQEDNEWVLVLKGSAIIGFEGGKEIELKEGDFLNIPKHQKHQVIWTDPTRVTVWLAIFY